MNKTNLVAAAKKPGEGLLTDCQTNKFCQRLEQKRVESMAVMERGQASKRGNTKSLLSLKDSKIFEVGCWPPVEPRNVIRVIPTEV